MKNICMIAFSHLPMDVRIKREAEALSDSGYSVDIICLKGKDEQSFQDYDGFSVHRIDLTYNKIGAFSYIGSYGLFSIKSMIKLIQLNKKQKYDTIHVHNPPDFLVLTAFPFKLLNRTRVILDIHDPFPEIFASRFERKMDSTFVHFLKKIQYICCIAADRIITVNDTIKNDLSSRGISNIFVVMNSPDEKLFDSSKRYTSKAEFNLEGKFIILYEGSIMKRRGLQILVEAVDSLKVEIPNICCLIAGDGDYFDTILSMIKDKSLEDYVIMLGHKPVEYMPKYVSIADICVIPFTDAPINDIGTPNKLFEYMIYDKPIIVPKLRAMSDLLSEDDCFFFEPGNYKDLASQIVKIRNLVESSQFIPIYKPVYEKCKWDLMKLKLLECYI
ncbi:glycosyltransferase family 4 protein [Methanolobus sp. WCC5]|uniref:glycosyltransferase family 4 protein n=1 Tax=Methanolobus sp. WCC5 TaxID=3125785 RepID=UPI0032475894